MQERPDLIIKREAGDRIVTTEQWTEQRSCTRELSVERTEAGTRLVISDASPYAVGITLDTSQVEALINRLQADC